MDTGSHIGKATLQMQTAHARFHWRTATVFAAVIVILGFVSTLNQGIRRVYYGGLGAAAAVALTMQYRRERALVSNRLLAVAVVTDWGKPPRSRSRFADAILARFSGKIPLVKYSFIAFDQKTYTGETGWGARGLYVGARMPVLYQPGNPAANHPLASFIFYSFR